MLKTVKNFKEDNINDIPVDKLEIVKNLVANPLFKKEIVFKASAPAGNFSMWIRAVIDTYAAIRLI